jgi:hypothetical protein
MSRRNNAVRLKRKHRARQLLAMHRIPRRHAENSSFVSLITHLLVIMKQVQDDEKMRAALN